MSLTIHNRNTTKMIEETQIESPTMKVVEDVDNEKERKAIDIRKNEKRRRNKKLKRSMGDDSA